jgi:ABC-2 type transport system ATP-binding protein
VREYLEFFADAFRVGSAKVVDAVLELTDIGRLSDKLVVTMSKGQKQRLQLARILLHDPKVLILDEPASDLDPRARIEIRDLLTELRALGKTVFLSSHILTELSDVCTSVGILEKGQLVVAGPIAEIGARLEAQRASAAIGHAPPPGPSAGVGLAGAPGAGAPPAVVAPSPLLARRRVRLRVLGPPAQVAAMLHGGPGIVAVEIAGGALLVTFDGSEGVIADIVAHLVRHGIGIVGVEQERNELERIFLEVTRGDMQ